jgi:ATP-dependent protease HslVU (ClpYQ) peptidase subunit
MTSIAYRDGVMAGDSRVTAGDLVLPDTCRKVHRLRNGALFGAAGNSEAIERLRRAIVRRTQIPKLEEVSALRVDPDGSLWSYEGSIWSKVDAPFAALGSGTTACLAAMYANATAREAVAIACKLDPSSGGRIHVVKLKCLSLRNSRL